MARLTRAAILALAIGHEEVDLGDGDTVEVRGLSRREAAEVQKADEGETRDAVMISLGLVDPVLTVDEVSAWFGTVPAGHANTLAAAIMRLSAMGDGQAKEYTKSVPRRRGRG